jgi:hypothetical protein
MRMWSAENPYYMVETSLDSVKIGFETTVDTLEKLKGRKYSAL